MHAIKICYARIITRLIVLCMQYVGRLTAGKAKIEM